MERAKEIALILRPGSSDQAGCFQLSEKADQQEQIGQRFPREKVFRSKESFLPVLSLQCCVAFTLTGLQVTHLSGMLVLELTGA